MPQESIRFRLSGDGLTAVLKGEIDHHTARAFREAIDRELYARRPRVLTLDLGEVTFMDSSGLGLILGRLARAAEMSATLRLTEVSEDVMKLLTLSGADRLRGLSVERGRRKESVG